MATSAGLVLGGQAGLAGLMASSRQLSSFQSIRNVTFSPLFALRSSARNPEASELFFCGFLGAKLV